MSERYGRARPKRWPLVGGGLIALVGLVWLGWAIWGQSTPKVTSEAVSFEVLDAHRARATINVHLSAVDVRATCLLRASAADHTVVGEVHFRIPVDRATDFKITKTVRTERRATSVESVGCTAAGQNRPR